MLVFQVFHTFEFKVLTYFSMFGSSTALTGRLEPPIQMASILSLDCWLVADQELPSEEELFFRIFAGVSELVDCLSQQSQTPRGLKSSLSSLSSPPALPWQHNL